MSIHETYVSLETAKLLKQIGFNWECIRYYQNSEETLYGPLVEQFKIISTNFNVAPIYMDQYSAPTLAVAQRWLREVKCLDIVVNRILPIHEMKYSYEYEYTVIAADGIVEATDCYFEEYEEALEAGIKKALEIILEKGE